MNYNRPQYAARSRANRGRNAARRKITGKATRAGSAFFATTEERINIHEWSRMLFVDPGHVKCGMARFLRSPDGIWTCSAAWKMPPLDALVWVYEWLHVPTPRLLGVEAFRLYPWAMAQQGFSEMGTPEVIGVLRWMHRQFGLPHTRLIMPGADKKEVGKALMVRAGIEPIGSNIDARVAEAHGWGIILKGGGRARG